MWALTNWALCVKNGDGEDKEMKSLRCKLGLLLPMAWAAAYVLERGLGASCTTELMTGNPVGPGTQAASSVGCEESALPSSSAQRASLCPAAVPLYLNHP